MDFSLVKSAELSNGCIDSNRFTVIILAIIIQLLQVAANNADFAKMNINALGGHFDIDHDGVATYWFLTPENIYAVDNDVAAITGSTSPSLG